MTVQTAMPELSTVLGERLSLSKADLAAHGTSETYFAPAPPDAVAYPETTEEVAEIVQNSSRASDIACRYGGEEFCLILPETVAWSARVVLERIRCTVAAQTVRHEDEDIKVTLSAGLVTVQGNYRGRIETAIEAADSALYRAKQSGRNCVVSGSVDASGRVVDPPLTRELSGFCLGAA